MLAIITSRTRALGQRAPGNSPFELDGSSPQATGALYLGAGNASGFVDASPFARTTTSNVAVHSPADELGMVAPEWTGTATGQRVTLPAERMLNTSKPFTVAAHVRLGAFATTYPYICQLMCNVTGEGAWRLLYSKNTAFSDVSIGSRNSPGTWIRLRGATPVAVTGEWHRVVVTYSGLGATTAGNFHIYVNSTDIALSGSGSFGTAGDANVLGAQASDGANYWRGHIAQFRVYDWEWPDALAAEDRPGARCAGRGAVGVTQTLGT